MPSRRPGLDGIRALAFISVLVAHVRVPHWFGGGLGVEMFFVLSGCLITWLLLSERERTGGLNIRAFYARRAWRLLPALVVLLVIFSAYNLTVARNSAWSPQHMLVTDASVIFYIGNWVRAFGGQNALGWFGHTWSLSIEEQFYLLWPLCMIAAFRWKGARGVLACSVIGVGASFAANAALSFDGASVDRVYNGTDTNAQSLLIGCALAACLVLRPTYTLRYCKWAWPLGACLLVWLAVMPPSGNWEVVSYPAIALATAAIIGYTWLAPHSGLVRFLAWRPLAAIGLISYGLYLWHFPILLAVEGHVHGVVERAVAVTMLTFVAAILSWRFVEQPVQNWSRRRRVGPEPPPITSEAVLADGHALSAQPRKPSALFWKPVREQAPVPDRPAATS